MFEPGDECLGVKHVRYPTVAVWSKYVDQELVLQLEVLQLDVLGPTTSPLVAQLQLQLDWAKPALSAPEAWLQLDWLQLDWL